MKYLVSFFIFISVLFSATSIFAGGVEITHRTLKTQIDLQLQRYELKEKLEKQGVRDVDIRNHLEMIKLEDKIVADDKQRLNLGIGEIIDFRIDPSPADGMPPFPLEETKWVVDIGKKYVDIVATETAPPPPPPDPPSSNDPIQIETKLPQTMGFLQNTGNNITFSTYFDPQTPPPPKVPRPIIPPSGYPGKETEPQGVVGRAVRITIKTGIPFPNNETDFAVLKVYNRNVRLGEFRMQLYRPVRWQAKMHPPVRSDEEHLSKDERNSSSDDTSDTEEDIRGNDGVRLFAGRSVTTLRMLVVPSFINFEALYFMEQDNNNSLFDVKPKEATEEPNGVFCQKYRQKYKHKTGDSDIENSFRHINYEKGFVDTKDDCGGNLVNHEIPINKDEKKIKVKVTATSREMKASVDKYGEHSFIWPCYYALYSLANGKVADEDFIPSEKTLVEIVGMKEYVSQKFTLKAEEKGGDTAYSSEWRKWNNFEKRTQYLSGKVFTKYESREKFRTQDNFDFDPNRDREKILND